MTIPEDFKTRLEIAKSKIKKQVQSDEEKKGSFMGNAFKLGTELVAAVVVGYPQNRSIGRQTQQLP